MEIEGTVQNGVVVPDGETHLPEGARVKLTTADAAPTHYDLFREIIGQAKDLPADMARNHNHYVRGGPKQ